MFSWDDSYEEELDDFNDLYHPKEGAFYLLWRGAENYYGEELRTIMARNYNHCHCEERSDAAIQVDMRNTGLPRRCAPRNDKCVDLRSSQ